MNSVINQFLNTLGELEKPLLYLLLFPTTFKQLVSITEWLQLCIILQINFYICFFLVQNGSKDITQTFNSVLCSVCGLCNQKNDANTCAWCLQSHVDITDGLERRVSITHCPECNTYLQPPRTWIKADLESKELLTFCLKRLKNMNLASHVGPFRICLDGAPLEKDKG